MKNIRAKKLEMNDLPINTGTVLEVKGKKVVIIGFGGIGDDRAFALPIRGSITWRGKIYKANCKMGLPLTANDVQKSLLRSGK
jgi:hypothetical protein